jgi:hypothetical protein
VHLGPGTVFGPTPALQPVPVPPLELEPASWPPSPGPLPVPDPDELELFVELLVPELLPLLPELELELEPEPLELPLPDPLVHIAGGRQALVDPPGGVQQIVP